MSKPLITIDQFVGMSDDGGIFYNEGFLPQKINGKNVFEETFKCSKVVDSTSTGFSSMTGSVSSIYNYYFSSDYTGLLMVDSSGNIFGHSYYSTADGKLHTIQTTATGYSDIIQTKNGNLLYTSGSYLGVGYYGICKTGSGTTAIVDTAGRNFATLGVVVGGATHNKITNLRTGIEYTITGIVNGDATNDKVTFSASGTNDNQEGDIFILWIDDKAWTGTATYFTTTAYPQFRGQEPELSFRRQIKLYGDVYYSLNGNYLAQLSSDETTLDDNYKQLPYRYQARAFDINSSKILVSATVDGRGKLLLWDGYSDGWNNILDIDAVCYALCSYGSGWLVFYNNTFYYTDGYQIQPISSPYPDDRPTSNSYNITPYGFGSLIVYGGRFFITNSVQNFSRINTGVLIYDSKSGWVFVPSEFSSRKQFKSYYPTAISVSSYWSGIFVAGNIGINLLSDNGNEDSDYKNKALMFYLYGGENFGIGQIELDISNNLRSYLEGSTTKPTRTKITVSVGDVKNGAFQYVQSKASGINATTNIDVNGTTFLGAEVGDEVQILEGTCSGERTFITAITNPGTTTESWTVSPALSATEASELAINMKLIKVRRCETKIIDGDNLNEPIKFDCNGNMSSKALVEIVVHGITTGTYQSFPVSINSIKVYGR